MAYVHDKVGCKLFTGHTKRCIEDVKKLSYPCTVSILNKETNYFEVIHFHIPKGCDISGTNMGWRYKMAKRDEIDFTESE